MAQTSVASAEHEICYGTSALRVEDGVTAQSRGEKKKKGKTQWKSLPLDIAPAYTSPRRKGTGGRKWENSTSKSPRRGRNQKGNVQAREPFADEILTAPLPVEQTAEMARQQIEYYFSVQNLCSDIYLRSCMDVDGYVPVVMLASFNRIASFHTDMPSLCTSLAESEYLYYEPENQKVRVRVGWENWLLPNAEGGRGVVSWVLVPEEEVVEQSAYQDE